MSGSRHYAAFISYSHADERWATWLHRKLEAFRVPARLVGTAGDFGPVPARIAPVFRDREELASSGDLNGRITQALEASAALVVLCSAEAANSRWVNEEIRRFRKGGHGQRVHCVLVPSERASNGSPVFPTALVESIDGGPVLAEPLAADLRDGGDGPVLGLQKLIAGLLGVDLDDLRQREAQRRQRRLAWITAGSVAGMGVAGLLALQAHIARNDAQRRQAQAEDLLGFMIDDLRPKLERVGRLDLLDDVGDKALRYFDSLEPRDLTDTTLSQQARALTQIGQVRLEQGKHDDALLAFREAFDRAEELARRAPRDGQRLFDLAQAEYWIGQVAWRRRDLDTAERWLVAYRDRSLALEALDPSRFDWQREVAYGHHNLAVLSDARGQYQAAAAAFEQELALYRRWLPEHPNDTLLRLEAANVASWLGSVSERLGQLEAAEAYFRQADDWNVANQSLEPDVKQWTDYRTATAVMLAQMLVRRGKADDARDLLRTTVAASRELVAFDAENATWRQSHGSALLALALAELRCGDRAATAALLAEAQPILAQALAVSPDDTLALTYAVRAALVEAELALHENRPADARAALARAEPPLARVSRQAPSDHLTLLSARHLELEAALLSLEGNEAEARERREAALQRLAPAGPDDAPVAFLETLIGLEAALGHHDAARRNEARLRSAGGHPPGQATSCPTLSAGSPASTRSGA